MSKLKYINDNWIDESQYPSNDSIDYFNYELGYYSELLTTINNKPLQANRVLLIQGCELFKCELENSYNIIVSQLRARVSEIR